ncbi:hypothetical protein AK812_SmicGene9766 [Symbiodinium microadriaticum]|uniref:Uncharacterized protein n=1 Tax=Symbiodinium microadriaticum TaxID=2951 RepID=A0A1Q9EHI7_SYMMI|nr:hypothetical protein AK812_SmicGene9766 [Symbiodinium microadriaticum]
MEECLVWHPRMESQELAEKLPEWRLVDRHVFEGDPEMVSSRKNLDCALIFTGTNTFGELGSSVHAGYRDEIWQLSDHAIWPKITAKLAKCNRDVFSGCINSGHAADADYKKLMWYKGAPELMPEIGSAEEAAAAWHRHLWYTYGTPAVADPPLKDSKTANGCFKGLRALWQKYSLLLEVYSENDLRGGGKQIDARTFSNNYFPHPKMNVLRAVQAVRGVCGGHITTDSLTRTGTNILRAAQGIKAKVYWDRLEQLVGSKAPNNELYAEAKKFVNFAWSAELTKEEVLANLKPPDKTESKGQLCRVDPEDPEEPALLAQDAETLDCALVMPGNWANTYTFLGENWGTKYTNELY